MDRIRVNTESLKRTENDVRNQIKAIRSALSEMRSQVTAMNRMWEGPANIAFNQTFQDNITDLDNLCAAVENIASYEALAHTEYVKCESKVSDVVRSINA